MSLTGHLENHISPSNDDELGVGPHNIDLNFDLELYFQIIKYLYVFSLVFSTALFVQ